MAKVLENQFTFTIANGQTVSGAVDLKEFVPVGIHMPAAFTGTAMSFQVSDSLAGTYQTMEIGAGAFTKTVSGGKYIALDPKDFYGVRYLKLVSGSAEGAARTLKLAARLFG